MLSIVPILSQSGVLAGNSVTDMCLLIWVTGQVAVLVINAIKGNSASSPQSAAAIQQLQAQVTDVAAKQLPPEVTSNLVDTIAKFHAATTQVQQVIAASAAKRTATSTPQPVAVVQQTIVPKSA